MTYFIFGNFVSIAKCELYHLPGAVNILADVLSRAICDNLNCTLPKEHPISRQWAKVLPTLPENFGVSHETLYKFLISPLQPEPGDIYDRKLKRLIEPKSVLTLYKESQSMTAEQKYYSAQTLLKQWLAKSEWDTKHDTQHHKIRLYEIWTKHIISPFEGILRSWRLF